MVNGQCTASKKNIQDERKTDCEPTIECNPTETIKAMKNLDPVLPDHGSHITHPRGTSKPGDYRYGSHSRLVAHNTYAACSRKWHDYEISVKKEGHAHLRDGGRRMTVSEKKPLQLLSDKKDTMMFAPECLNWIQEREKKNDLFQQQGHWASLYIETPLVSFHVEYRRSNLDIDVENQCNFQSLDAWMTTVSDTLEREDWKGILGETKSKLYDADGQQIMSDRQLLLTGEEDVDYEVDGPFGSDFMAARLKRNSFEKLASYLS